MNEWSAFWSMIVQGMTTLFTYTTEMRFGEFSLMNVAVFSLVLTLLWRFVLRPIFGSGGSSGMSVDLSDKVYYERDKRSIGFGDQTVKKGGFRFRK